MNRKLRVFYFNTFLRGKLGEGIVSRRFWAEAMKLDGWELVTVPPFSLEKSPSSVNPYRSQSPLQYGRSFIKSLTPRTIRQVIRDWRSPISRLPIAPYFYTRRMTQLVRQTIREQGPFDVYLLHLSQADLETLARLCHSLDVPIVLRVPAPLAYEADCVFHRHMSQRDRHNEQYLYQRAHAISVISQDMKEMLIQQGIDANKIHVFPNGLDFDSFTPERIDANRVRQQYGLNGRKVVGYVGGFWPGNDMDTLMQAWKLVEEKESDVSLLLVGDGPRRPETLMLAKQLGVRCYIWVGHVPHSEVPSYLAAMDIGIGPYIKEAAKFVSPLKVIEYTAMGLPVVATDGGQLRELVQHGVTGHTYPAGDAEQLATSILTLLRSPETAATMSRRAKERMRDWHSWDRLAEQTLVLCAKALNEEQGC